MEISVLDFGADPLGKKDSTKAFQNAIYESSKWNLWNGGENPVDSGILVNVIDRSGFQIEAFSQDLNWSHNGSDSDIVNYQVVE